MGCANSKQKVCRNCHVPYSPVRRSHSMPHWHHSPPPENGVDIHHTVALTSSTLGSLMLDPLNQNQIHCIEEEEEDGVSVRKKGEEILEAMSWSQMIDKKIPKTPARMIPKTPARTPIGEPETINAWELMEDLEDISPLIKPCSPHIRSFSFHISPNQIPSLYTPRAKDDTEASPKPPWSDAEAEEAENESNSTSASSAGFESEFDPEVIAAFRKALDELPPATPFRLKPLISDNIDNGEVAKTEHTKQSKGKNRVIVYFTSLRGVRRTYEDCCYVRTVLQGLGVKIDDRDVSMHSGFKEELKELLGEVYKGGGLPRVFVGNDYIGGADEIRKMHEDGQLEKLLQCCEGMDDAGVFRGGGGGEKNGVCEICGDIRFVPCETCSGSCKIYCESGGCSDGDEDEYGFQRCPDCNENGLIRCPTCCN